MTAKVPSVNSNGFLDLDKQVNCKNASYCTFDVVGSKVQQKKKKITSRKSAEVYLLNALGFVFTKRRTNYYVLRTHCT